MPEIVSIFQAPLWKKIVVSSNDSVGYASSYFILKNSVAFEKISIVKLYAPLQGI